MCKFKRSAVSSLSCAWVSMGLEAAILYRLNMDLSTSSYGGRKKTHQQSCVREKIMPPNEFGSPKFLIDFWVSVLDFGVWSCLNPLALLQLRSLW